jgi:hypothetical protein
MSDERTIRSRAASIEQVRKTHELILPVTAQFPEATIEDAYALHKLDLLTLRMVAKFGVSLSPASIAANPSINHPVANRAYAGRKLH